MQIAELGVMTDALFGECREELVYPGARFCDCLVRRRGTQCQAVDVHDLYGLQTYLSQNSSDVGGAEVVTGAVALAIDTFRRHHEIDGSVLQQPFAAVWRVNK